MYGTTTYKGCNLNGKPQKEAKKVLRKVSAVSGSIEGNG